MEKVGSTVAGREGNQHTRYLLGGGLSPASTSYDAGDVSQGSDEPAVRHASYPGAKTKTHIIGLLGS